MARHTTENRGGGLTTVEFPNKQVGYTDAGLSSLLKDRRRLERMVELFPVLDKRNKPNAFVEDGDVRITEKGYLGPEKRKDEQSFYYKLEVPEGSFFVKRIPAGLGYETGGGYEEILDTHEAKDLLKDEMDIEIVDYVLGSEDNKNLFFVSKWDDRLELTMDQHIENLHHRINEGDVTAAEELEVLQTKLEHIKDVLGNKYWDTRFGNMSYDRKTGKILIFDLNKTKDFI